jgi:hypothetical protein
MAKWVKIGPVKGDGRRSYVGWSRTHPTIHIGEKEPARKASLVQIHEDNGVFTVLALTASHGIFTQPPGVKGTTLFKKTVIKYARSDAMAEAQRLKKMLADRYDSVTRHYARGMR